jgi:two-component system chemotaxis response regulator CheY
MKILIVDDSAFMRTILKDLIPNSKWAGATILEAENGEQAITISGTEKPDLILLDVVMPGKDGIAVLKEIGSTMPSVVIVSSMGQEQIIDQAKTLGAKDYIVKPFDARRVIESLDKLYPESAGAAADTAATAAPTADPAGSAATDTTGAMPSPATGPAAPEQPTTSPVVDAGNSAPPAQDQQPSA